MTQVTRPARNRPLRTPSTRGRPDRTDGHLEEETSMRGDSGPEKRADDTIRVTLSGPVASAGVQRSSDAIAVPGASSDA